jgi:hypothetical protein
MDEKEGLPYKEYHRIDLLCGFVHRPPVFPCKICNKTNCQGVKKDCKGYGSYVLGIKAI